MGFKMKKYIRTKDGGIHYNLVEDAEKHLVGIIKQANTIEELCDEFVYVASEKDRPVVCYKPTAFHKLSDNLYGAIWTDKGLIYVAKMNEEGELELL